MTNQRGIVDPALEEKVLQDAADASSSSDRRKGWSPEVRVLVIMLACGLMMNGVGLFAIWMTNYLDSRRNDNQVVQIDCNSAARLSELEEGVSKILDIPKDAIRIRPCDKKEK